MCAGCRDKCRDKPACAATGECKSRASSCRVGSAADCRGSKLCTAGGECAAVPDPEGGGELMCGAEADSDCRASEVCARFGQCSAQDGACKATAGDDCRRSPACAKHGSCVAAHGKCLPGSASDCKGSEDCRLHGLCTFQPEAEDYQACTARMRQPGINSAVIPSAHCPGSPDQLLLAGRILGSGHPSDLCHAMCVASSGGTPAAPASK